MPPFKSGYVAIVGCPNVGKSTLINVILGEQLAIVTPKPQTTRHKISGILNIEGAQIVFLDTPGYHRSSKPLNQVMNEIVDSALGDADIICLMVDASALSNKFFYTALPSSRDPQRTPEHASGLTRRAPCLKEFLGQCHQELNGHGIGDTDIEKELFDRAGADRAIVVLNKCDLIGRDKYGALAESFRKEWGAKELVIISALKNEGVLTLIGAIKERLPEGEAFFPDDIYTDHSVRFIAAEMIRKQVFLQMREEIPHSTGVQIEEFKDAAEKDPITRIIASIIVEKESQKGMVIGKGGTRIKAIGKNARLEIEKLVDGKVYLELNVKVEPNWTKDRERVEKLRHSQG